MALKVAERSCDIRRVTLRHDHPDVLAARETLGIIYLHLLQYDDAAREVRRKKERALRYDYQLVHAKVSRIVPMFTHATWTYAHCDPTPDTRHLTLDT